MLKHDNDRDLSAQISRQDALGRAISDWMALDYLPDSQAPRIERGR